MKVSYWIRLSVMCVAVALVSAWQATNVLAGDTIFGLNSNKIGSGQFQQIPPSSGTQKVLQMDPNFAKALTLPSSGPQKMLQMNPNLMKALAPKSVPSAQLDPKFNPNNWGLGKGNLKLNPDLAGKLKSNFPKPDGSGVGSGSGGGKPASGKWWGSPLGKKAFGHHPIWPGPAYYGSNFGGSYDYGPSNNLPPANVLPSAPTLMAIENPASTGVTIQFLLDGQAGSLEPGQRIEIGQFNPQVVEFDRGGQFGAARYGLEEGTYTFAVTPQGIELYHGAYTVAE